MPKKQTFEQALHQLEEVVETLESGQLPLEESLKLFEKGVGHAAKCRQELQAVELKVEKLVQDARGNLKTEAQIDPQESN